MASETSLGSAFAQRYATALYELADEARQLDAVAADLRGLGATIETSPDLLRVLRSPLINRQTQTRAVLAVLEAAGTGDLVRRFVGVVGGNRRLFALPAMIAAFLARLAQRRGEVTAHVRSARPLSPEQQAALGEALRGVVGRKVNLESRTEPGLIGGMIVRVGSRMIDTSLRTQLQKLHRALRAA